MPSNWEKRSFQMASGSLKESKTETNLPFSIGGITKQGKEHIKLGISNQDAVNFRIDSELIIGILCDGCTSHHESLLSNYSSNQAGALLLSEMIVNYCYKDIHVRKNRMNLDKFLQNLERALLSKINRISKSCSVSDDDRLSFFYNYFTSTTIGFVIRKKEYFIFGCGDGYVGVNDKTINLKRHSGNYLVNRFDPSADLSKKLFHILKRGKTDDLNHLYLASDGFDHSSILKSDFFKDLRFKSAFPYSGYIDLIPEFHLNVINPYFDNETQEERWPIDDSSLILLRRNI